MFTRPKRTVAVFAAALTVLVAPALGADAPPTSPPQETSPGAQARQGLELLMKALEGFFRQMPVYGPPEILPNGDIIIRRLDREEPEPPSALVPEGGTKL